jgi:ABC-type transporter Mla subunit MlaD
VSSRRPNASIFASPVLIGAVTTLIIVIAVFLAYNANKGLPFLPTRLVKVQLHNGAELVKGNDVRQGGFRIGIVSDLKPVRFGDGTVGALASLKIDSKYGALPDNSRVMIRPRSALGLKYVDIMRGNSPKLLPDGATVAVTQNIDQVDLDQVYNIFDSKTRSAAQTNLHEFGNAFSGRGPDLNATIRALPATLKLLTPVAHNLADPTTQLPNFFKQLEITVRTIAPVAGVQARLFTTMANTWAAISRDPQALKDTISKSPPTLDVGTASLRTQIPFLRDTAALSRDFNTATRELRASLPTLNSALRVAVPVTQRSVSAGLYPKLQDALGALRDLTQAPTTNAALRGLTATVETLQPQLRFLGPYVTVCNQWNFWWTYVGEHFSEPNPTGTAQRALLNFAPLGLNGLGAQGAAHPVNGGATPNSEPPLTQPSGVAQADPFFHNPQNPAAITNNGLADCETGQRGYIRGSIPVSNQYGSPPYQHVVMDAHPRLGYRAGSNFAHVVNGVGAGRGPDQVPPGETFTREPGGIGAVAP